jgi:hypothetical protein
MRWRAGLPTCYFVPFGRATPHAPVDWPVWKASKRKRDVEAVVSKAITNVLTLGAEKVLRNLTRLSTPSFQASQKPCWTMNNTHNLNFIFHGTVLLSTLPPTVGTLSTGSLALGKRISETCAHGGRGVSIMQVLRLQGSRLRLSSEATDVGNVSPTAIHGSF